MYINLLGSFDIRVDDKSIIPKSKRTSKLLKLLEYFLTFKNQGLLPETIINNLWMDSDSQDPMNMIRGQIFRLRQLLKDMLPDDETLKIEFEDGYYTLEVSKDVILDIDQMENFIKEGDLQLEKNREESIPLYLQAINLYRGKYLWDYEYEMWLVPVRNYYRKQYLKTVEKLVDIYRVKNSPEKVVELVERAIEKVPSELSLREILINTLLNEGKLKEAEEEFDNLKNEFEKRLGVLNSTSLKETQRKLKKHITEKKELSNDVLESKLDKEIKPGPVRFDSEYFKIMYNSSKRKRQEEGTKDFLGLISLIDYEDDYKEELHIRSFNNLISKAIISSLRKGDIFTFWNDKQVLILIEGVKLGGEEAIKDRIKRRFDMINQYPMSIEIKFIQIQEGEDPEIFK